MKRFNIYEEANRCLLCQDAPCTKACPTGDPARALRAIRFDNHKPALRFVADCTDANLEAAERACIHYNPPIRIRDIIHAISPDDVDDTHYPDLAIDFCGIRCENPFFLASSAVCTNYEMVARAFDASSVPPVPSTFRNASRRSLFNDKCLALNDMTKLICEATLFENLLATRKDSAKSASACL